MPFEDFDSKLRQAAEQHHPHYDEKAWSKMEKLLNRELPEKKDDKRRIILLLLTLFLLGGGIWIIIARPWENKTSAVAADSIIPKNEQQEGKQGSGATTAPDNGGDAAASPAGEGSGGELQKATSIDGSSDGTSTPIVTDRVGTNNTTTSSATEENGSPKGTSVIGNVGGDKFDIHISNGQTASRPRLGDKDATVLDKDKDKSDRAGEPLTSITPDKTVPKQQGPGNPGTTGNTDHGNTDLVKATSPVTTTASDAGVVKAPDVKQKDAETDNPKTAPEKVVAKPKSKKPNTFFFSVSAGPDVSSVGFDNPGKLTLLKGAGLGYTIKDRWTIRTGFYSVSKVYTASPDEYKPTNPVNRYYLKSIAADCEIYEIPLSLSYQWGRSGKRKTFVSAGLSSFLMKSEAYRYKYLYPGNPNPSYYTHREKNENKHYFLVLSLSGGYQQRINRTFSVSLEPYVKLPLSGIGYGKIKLNSAGVMVSVSVSPFK